MDNGRAPVWSPRTWPVGSELSGASKRRRDCDAADGDDLPRRTQAHDPCVRCTDRCEGRNQPDRVPDGGSEPPP